MTARQKQETAAERARRLRDEHAAATVPAPDTPRVAQLRRLLGGAQRASAEVADGVRPADDRLQVGAELRNIQGEFEQAEAAVRQQQRQNADEIGAEQRRAQAAADLDAGKIAARMLDAARKRIADDGQTVELAERRLSELTGSMVRLKVEDDDDLRQLVEHGQREPMVRGQAIIGAVAQVADRLPDDARPLSVIVLRRDFGGALTVPIDLLEPLPRELRAR